MAVAAEITVGKCIQSWFLPSALVWLLVITPSSPKQGKADPVSNTTAQRPSIYGVRLIVAHGGQSASLGTDLFTVSFGVFWSESSRLWENQHSLT